MHLTTSDHLVCWEYICSFMQVKTELVVSWQEYLLNFVFGRYFFPKKTRFPFSPVQN